MSAITAWLEGVRLGQLARTFQDNDIDLLAELNRPGFAGEANTPRIADHGIEDQLEAVFARVS